MVKAPVNILLLGDIHGNEAWLAMACRAAVDNGCPIILQLGDFGFWPHERAGARFLDTVDQLVELHDLDLYWIDGNHENHEVLIKLPRRDDGTISIGPRCTYLPRGHRWTWHGVRFGALGGAFSVDWRRRTLGVSWWREEMITDVDVRALGDDPLEVLVTHDCPKGIDLAGWALPEIDELRANEVRELIERAVRATTPKLIVHGHWHVRHTNALSWLTDSPGTHWQSAIVDGFGCDGDAEGIAGVLTLPDLTINPVSFKTA